MALINKNNGLFFPGSQTLLLFVSNELNQTDCAALCLLPPGRLMWNVLCVLGLICKERCCFGSGMCRRFCAAEGTCNLQIVELVFIRHR